MKINEFKTRVASNPWHPYEDITLCDSYKVRTERNAVVKACWAHVFDKRALIFFGGRVMKLPAAIPDCRFHAIDHIL